MSKSDVYYKGTVIYIYIIYCRRSRRRVRLGQKLKIETGIGTEPMHWGAQDDQLAVPALFEDGALEAVAATMKATGRQLGGMFACTSPSSCMARAGGPCVCLAEGAAAKTSPAQPQRTANRPQRAQRCHQTGRWPSGLEAPSRPRVQESSFHKLCRFSHGPHCH